MKNIENVFVTDLFWETLEQQRKHPFYVEFRAAIGHCIAQKANDRNFTNHNDKLFTRSPGLKGSWHCKLSRATEIIMFYKLEGDTMFLGMIGDHTNYSWNGKNMSADMTTATRIARATARGHKPLPDWETVKWSTPVDLLTHPDLHEASLTALDRVHEALVEEAGSMKLLEKRHGPVDEVSDEIYGPWIEAVDSAILKVEEIQTKRAKLLREFKDGIPALTAFKM